MDLTDYLRVLRKRWRTVVAVVAVALVVAGLASAAATRQYSASTQLFVSMRGSDDATSLQQGGNFATQRVKSYEDVVRSPRVLGPVIADLQLPTTPARLADRVAASAPMGTVLLEVDVTDPSPRRAAQVANAIARHFITTVGELESSAAPAQSPVRVSVLREAEVPASPVSPRVPLDLALGLLVGLSLGGGAALLREMLDTTVTSTDAVSELGLPALGVTLHAAGGGGSSALVETLSHTPQAEALRQIRTNLQFVDVDNPPRTVVVTSSLPGEGKTTTAINLALTMAMAGVRTILVEADLRLPKVAEYLGIEGGVGLTTVLAGQAEVDDVLQPYGHFGLQVLPSGATPPNPSELLGSWHMVRLLEALRERADLVVIDTPPLLPVTDAAVLGRQVDGAIVVVRHGRTTRDQATRALERLSAVDARVLGGVLSMVPPNSDAGTYGYSYGYGETVEADDDASVKPVLVGSSKAPV